MTNTVLRLLNYCNSIETEIMFPESDSFDLDTLAGKGYVYANGYADTVFCCEDAGEVEIERLNDSNGNMTVWRCCPICGAKKMDQRKLQKWKVNFLFLLEQISKELGLVTPREEIPSVLYYLGMKSGSPIYYLRSIDGCWRRNVEKIVDNPASVILLNNERQRLFYADYYDKPVLLLQDFSLEDQGEEGRAARSAFETSLLNLGLVQDLSRPQYRFVKRSGWYIKYETAETFLPGDLIGLEYIWQLLKYPGKEVSVTKFFQEISGSSKPIYVGKGDERMDAESKKACQKRLVEIKEERLAAKERRDRQAYDALGEEADYLKKTLKTNEEYFGKKQRIGDDLRNLRRRVSDRIKAALEKIAESDPRLAAHLDSSIVRGVSLVYKPEKNIPWRFN